MNSLSFISTYFIRLYFWRKMNVTFSSCRKGRGIIQTNKPSFVTVCYNCLPVPFLFWKKSMDFAKAIMQKLGNHTEIATAILMTTTKVFFYFPSGIVICQLIIYSTNRSPFLEANYSTVFICFTLF